MFTAETDKNMFEEKLNKQAIINTLSVDEPYPNFNHTEST